MRILISLLLIILLASCAPAPASPAVPEGMAGENQAERAASPAAGAEAATATPTSGAAAEGKEPLVLELTRQDLALRLGLDPAGIDLLSLESLAWPDSGLGCPLPGAAYAQVLTPGFRISLEAAGEVYTYHTDAEVSFVLCQDGSPQLPLIPLIPGEIKDGDPWMPVDPPPNADEGGPSLDPAPVY